MKKLINALMIILLTFPLAMNAQVYQLPNPGFENWDNNYASSDDEPANWNGFPSANCTVSLGCSAATATRHERSTDVRPGSTGSYSCKIFATVVNIIFTSVTANGNLTTGQINIGSTTADDETENYNFTNRSNEALNQPFNGKPDSIRFWAKFSCPSSSQYARMSCIIHDDYNEHDPYTTTEQESHLVATAVREFQQTGSWVEYKAAFDYNHSATTPAYILITFTTNKVAGAGSANDNLWIDDIELIYHAELSDLTSGGTTVPGFAANTLEYNIELENGAELPEVGYTTLSPNATATVTQPTAENPTATVVVTHGDQTKTYTIHYTFAAEMDAALSDLQLNGTTVEGFNPAVTDYDVVIFGTEVPTLSATPRNPEASVVITQPTTDNLVGIVAVTDRDSSRTYTVNITLVEANADLSDLQLGGVTINGFDPAVTEYTITHESDLEIPELSATAASEYATVALTQATLENPVATATVTCGELTKTYTVNFTIVESVREAEANHFNLYPNPTNDQITLILDENVNASEVVLYNMTGQTVLVQKINANQTVINVRNLQSGIYFAAVRNGNSIIGIQKIVKE